MYYYFEGIFDGLLRCEDIFISNVMRFPYSAIDLKLFFEFSSIEITPLLLAGVLHLKTCLSHGGLARPVRQNACATLISLQPI